MTRLIRYTFPLDFWQWPPTYLNSGLTCTNTWLQTSLNLEGDDANLLSSNWTVNKIRPSLIDRQRLNGAEKGNKVRQ